MTGWSSVGGWAPTQIFDAALDGEVCSVHVRGGGTRALSLRRWSGLADSSDRAVLAHCVGRTIDLGCGPGRMAQALQRGGQPVLGVDLAAGAVAATRRRGVQALQSDIFDPLPGEGSWDSALLADGNIGIGGDPGRLLSRVRRLLRPGGLVVVDLAPPGAGLQRHTLALSAAGRMSHPFGWAVLGADALSVVAAEADLLVRAVHDRPGRWFAVLQRGAAVPSWLG